jgi:CRP-like cAMP-binding protein
VFAQGDRADAVFYIQQGQVKISVISEQGKEAVVALLQAREFLGEGCLAGQTRRQATAEAMSDCEIMRLDKAAIMQVIHDEPEFAEKFIAYVLSGASARKRIWSISYSTPAKSVWRARFFSLRISERRDDPSRLFRK